MKGIIIYEDYRGKEVVEAIKLDTVNYKCTSDDDWISELSGIRKESTQAWCNKEDTYDFRVGALIALMKMCGFDKSYKAIEEAFKYNSYDTKKNKELEEEINILKKRINELEIYNNQLEDRVAGEQRGGYKLLKDMEKLQHEYDLCRNSENALKCSVDYLNKTIAKLNTAIYGYKEDLNKVTKRCRELETKEDILNKKEETIIKRDEMWENILRASKRPPVEIKVAKQDITSFLRELQDKIPEAMWNGSDDCLPSEYTNPYWFKHEHIYFALFRYDDKEKLRICYDDHKHSWIDKPVIEYIAPMRWDLFKKGRLAVKVDYDNYKEFYEACKKELGKRPLTNFACIFTVSICKKDGFFEIFTVEDQKKTGRKIVDWEDVR